MKKNICVLLSITLLTLNLYAQKNLLKIDLHSPIARTGIISFERVLNNNSTLGISFLYCDATEMFNADLLDRIAVSPEYRFYLQEKHPAPEGFYLLTLFRYQHMTASWYEYDELGASSWLEKDKDTFGAAVGVGFQAIFKERIALDMHLGTIFNSGEEKQDPQVILPYYDDYNYNAFEPYVGYFIISGVKIGFVF
ncbi:MAG: DUF3575 domain-containing protein [Flavobacteriales bacterium]|nr:DUF3575 domain-containing protein [Flavobacteriales bacterium]